MPLALPGYLTFMALRGFTSALGRSTPVMVISLRAAAGSKNPSEIIVATIFATAASMAVAIVVSKLFARWYARKPQQGGAA